MTLVLGNRKVMQDISFALMHFSSFELFHRKYCSAYRSDRYVNKFGRCASDWKNNEYAIYLSNLHRIQSYFAVAHICATTAGNKLCYARVNKRRVFQRRVLHATCWNGSKYQARGRRWTG